MNSIVVARNGAMLALVCLLGMLSTQIVASPTFNMMSTTMLSDETQQVISPASPLLVAQYAPDSPSLSASKIQQRIHKIIAGYAGVPVNKIDRNTDLIDDLYADPMGAFELFAILCEKFDIPLPTRSDLTNVGDITDYILQQLRVAQIGQSGTRGLGGPRSAESVHGTESAITGPSQVYVQKIFYATDRQLEQARYGGKRASDDRVSYGMCEVSIPVAVHKRGHLERPSLLRLEWREDPKKHIVLQKVEQLKWDVFLSRLKQRLAVSDRDAFVFIHGFNVSFDAAARRTAQISYDLDFKGAPLMFSWPSDGSVMSYFSDREDVEWAVPHLEAFLQDLLSKTEIERLHLIAHSMGNQGLIRALHRIALRRGEDNRPLFENIILAAPDFDAQVFTDHIAPEVISLGKRWTLYASDKDKALDVSTALAAKRLGLPLSVIKGVDTVDATGIEVTPWSVPEFHSYYASKRKVINDLIGVLSGLAPMQRDLKPRLKNGLNYWELLGVR